MGFTTAPRILPGLRVAHIIRGGARIGSRDVCKSYPSQAWSWSGSSSSSREYHSCIRSSISTIPTRSYRRTKPNIARTNHQTTHTTTDALLFTTTKRCMSDEIGRGTDLLADSLAHGPRRKIVLESYAPSGVDVKGLVQVGDIPDEGDLSGEDKIIHMNGSIVAFPDTCFLFNVENPKELTLDTLSVVKLYHPVVEYLFIGCDKPMLPRELSKIKKEFRKRDIVVEQMDVMNAMGTFNILNGEDRRVACVLVIDPNDE